MMEPLPPRSTAEKLALFRASFSGRDHVYGTYDPPSGRVRQVKQPVTDAVLLRHLQGIQSYGVYLLVGDRARAVVADFDREDVNGPLKLLSCAERVGIPAYLERSKSKGWHAWVFLEQPGVSAAKARAVVRWLLCEAGCPSVEIFPKQDRLEGRNMYGNFVNAPLFGRLVPGGRTVFVDPRDDLKPWTDQWAVLEQVHRVSESVLTDIISNNHPALSGSNAKHSDQSTTSTPIVATFGLAPCAQRMLAEGVVEYQRVACFRLALHLKKAGLPKDIATACLFAWAKKNRPRGGKQIITVTEIESQTQVAYSKDYRGCGCEEAAIQPYCLPTCALFGSRQLADGSPADPKNSCRPSTG
jgi:hypothetical protein